MSSELTEFPLNHLYFYLTRGCNLRCRHCWIAPTYQSPGSKPQPSLPLGIFEQIIEQAKTLGLTSVKLTGGEPLLHPKIHEILEVIHCNDLRLNVETNGTLCTPKLARKLAADHDPFIAVSLDGVNAETHDWIRGVQGAFTSTLIGMRNLVEAGLAPQIIMTLMPINSDQMEDMVRLAESIGVKSVKFNILQPAGRGKSLNDNGNVLNISEMVRIGEWVEMSLANQASIKVIYSHPPAFRPLGRMLGKDLDGCSGCDILRIMGVLSDGSYSLCGIGETVPDLIFGNAENHNLIDVWENSSILAEIRRGIPEKLGGLCARCTMKQLCNGHCLAQNYQTAKKIFAPFWYCEEAMDAGLFPTSRLKPDDLNYSLS